MYNFVAVIFIGYWDKVCAPVTLGALPPVGAVCLDLHAATRAKAPLLKRATGAFCSLLLPRARLRPQAMRRPTQGPYRWEYRAVYFSAVWVSQVTTFSYALYHEPCLKSNFNWPMDYAMDLYFVGFIVDSLQLLRKCHLRVQAQVWPHGYAAPGLRHPTRSYLRHVIPFASLPVCYALGVVFLNVKNFMCVYFFARGQRKFGDGKTNR
jgi:hypothetical protein